MTGRRVQLAQLLDRTGVTGGMLRVMRRFGSPWITVLTYHHIHRPDAAYSFDRGVIDAYPRAFDEQVATLKRYFSVLGLDELRAHVVNGRELPPNPALITFDDGYLSCHDCALPILQRHGAKAVFFIATHYIEERRIFWWDRIAYVLRPHQADRIELTYPETLHLSLSSDAKQAAKRLLRAVKSHHDLDLPRFLSELADKAEVRWDDEIERELADRMICTWDHVRALRDAGMAVQSHTRHHHPLQTLPAARLQEELAGSKADLEAKLEQEIYALSYPDGEPILGQPQICAAMSAAGYELGFSYGTGVISRRNKPHAYDLRRTGFNADQPASFFRSALAIPPLVYKHDR
jgi:peptidoglycan/xylan/chitin deacetylase (PgdA/CDA1 family)